MLHGQIMLALHSYSSIHVPSFEFWGLFHALGGIFACFGTIEHHTSVLEHMPLYAIIHPFNAFVELCFVP